MTGKPETYPAIYIIFTLLNAIRRGIERRNIWREFRRQKIALKPRLSFWVAVCRQAGLLNEQEGHLRLMPYARRWVSKSPQEQTFHLIESWQNAPRNHKVRQFRKKLLWKLKYAQPLTQKDLRALSGLEALGLIANGQLTKWGKFFINPARFKTTFGSACGVNGEGELPSPKTVEPCKLQENQFIASVPAHADLLWELERFLRPSSPGLYPLTQRALKFYNGDPCNLIELLERGMGEPIPDRTKALILGQPSIRIANGTVIEFSSPAELKQLRRQPVFRRHVAEFLSSRCILISGEKTEDFLALLNRRGAHVFRNEEQVPSRKKRTHFPASPPKTLMKPLGREIPILSIIEKYQQLGLALDILYRVPGYPAEQRRITPLLIEERGGHTYIIAHCQTRRARRTFRLDRMAIPGTW